MLDMLIIVVCESIEVCMSHCAFTCVCAFTITCLCVCVCACLICSLVYVLQVTLAKLSGNCMHA